ncbi:MAG: CrcB family protein, partial [Hyphomicrobiaceae bacterium]
LNFPWGTLTVNVLGSFLMGILIGFLALRVSGGENLRVFLAVGVLGGFTTFSAFSLDVFYLMERKSHGLAFLYASASVFLSIAALFIGLYLARQGLR